MPSEVRRTFIESRGTLTPSLLKDAVPAGYGVRCVPLNLCDILLKFNSSLRYGVPTEYGVRRLQVVTFILSDIYLFCWYGVPAGYVVRWVRVYLCILNEILILSCGTAYSPGTTYDDFKFILVF
jgi:hypothetical protein